MNFEPIHTGHALTNSIITQLFAGFCDLSLPKAHWTHEAHLIGTLCLIRDFGVTEAETKMPDMIRAFNIANGGVNTDTEGYHETLTVFYLRILAKFYVNTMHMPFSRLCEATISADIGERQYPLNYYSKDVLFSIKARKHWVEPDIMPL